MSCITNEPKHKTAYWQAIREQLEHRAMWLYPAVRRSTAEGLGLEDFS